ncbi:MAG: FtsX-like permease family protein [Ruminococcus sp.]|nr:FtsX-like permease family protein [Ruminococcus sp.]
MKSAIKKSSLREIRGTFGRFFAILAIIALGVGFFSGVRVTTPAMVQTVDDFLQENQFYDYRLLSTLGWEEDDIEDFRTRKDVRYAEGAYSLDVLIASGSREEVYKVHSITDNINGIKLKSGRMPEKAGECVVEYRKDREWVGKDIKISSENTDRTKEAFPSDTLKVVGTADSSLYINFERGTTSIGNGSIEGFIYVLPDTFTLEQYTEAYIRFDEDYVIYSDEYDDFMSGREEQWQDIAQERADMRYDSLYSEADEKISESRAELEKNRADGQSSLDDAKKQLDDTQSQLDEQAKQLEQIKALSPKDYEAGKAQLDEGCKQLEQGRADYEASLAEFNEKIADGESQLADAEKELSKLKKPDTYVLGRNTNIGYACFESDSEIVAQVARIFPIFFILVAALVCMTTMSRMVEEQRTETGVLKALGYSESSIMGKFMFYSGLAAVIGCVLGFAVGTVLFPRVIWMTYELMYLNLPMRYLFDKKMAAAALAASLLCSIGTTWISCRVELRETAAQLMRPRSPKAGKRVLLEYIPFIWEKLKFLHKVSIRNIFRYKKRFFMMIIGISGCTALLVTGFGIKDSIAGFAEVQYDTIQTADAQAGFKTENGDIPENVRELLAEDTDGYLPMYTGSWDLLYGKKVKSITLNAPEDYSDFGKYFDLHTESGETVSPPKEGEAVVSHSVSERYNVKKGDEIVLRNEDMKELHLKVTGVFENHVYNYVFTTFGTLEKQLGTSQELNSAYIDFPADADVREAAKELSRNSSVTVVTQFQDLKVRLSKMMSSLDYIVLIVIVSAAGLAFVVIYNLTNINITERVREIATIKVLGFFRRETSAYVLRENIALTAIGTAVGLVLGIFVHRFVMAQIVVDMVEFSVRIKPESFVYSAVLTFLFNFIIDLFMEIKLERINMAESLKSVE